MQEIIIIAAMAENRVIGKNNVMPWSIKEDMAHFRELTKGCPCIMGRKTWDSLFKKPLPGRLNIVISQSLPADAAPGATVLPSLQAAVQHCAAYEKIFICGGETIYRQALPLAGKLELTLIHQQYEGDTFFPEIDNDCWTMTNTENFNGFSFVSYERAGYRT
jgi:dihydrofolate reductase